MQEERTSKQLQQRGPAVYLETFGCQMNVLDSQLVRGQLQAGGYHFVDEWKQADVVLYNTCSVRERAEQKVWSRVGEVGVYKREHPELVLGVIGCMAERDGKDMVRKYPQIDLLCGPGELDKVPALIDNVMKTSLEQRGGVRQAKIALQGNAHRRSGTLTAAQDDLEMIDLSRSFSPDEHQGSAYVRITRGCNKFCTYCVVPNTRGAEVHRPPEHILEECRQLLEAGVKEITLLGQTVNHYHYDHASAVTIDGVKQPQVGSIIGPNRGTGGPSPTFHENTTTFANLLAMIHDELPDLQRLRFVTSFPRDFGNDILDVIASRPRICRYFHLPVQSGSNRLLKMMNRGYTVQDFVDLVDRIRERMPDAELATDIICGFPSETEEDHQATARLLEQCRFKNSFIFKYSPRPGTVAYDRLEDDVTDAEKKRRNNDLLAIQTRVSKEIHKSYVGRTVRVFIESMSTMQRRANKRVETGGQVILGWENREGAASAQIACETEAGPTEEYLQLSGRTDGDLIVCLEGPASWVGQIRDVEIERAASLTLFGRCVDVAEPASV